MTTHQTNPKEAVLDLLEAALADTEGAPDREALRGALSRPPDAARGDVAFPVFPLAKLLRNAPPKIAAELAQKITDGLDGNSLVARVEAAGPYLNFFTHAGRVLCGLLESIGSGAWGKDLQADTAQRVMVEFSQPNTHKVLHVGHLRNIAVGDALQRVLRARGHGVVSANYYGDFGIDVAKCLWWLREHPEDTAPETQRGAWLGQAYAAASAHIADLEDKGDKQAVQELFAELKSILERIVAGDAELEPLYRETRRWCLDEFAEVYRWLDVEFDTDFFESELDEAGQKIVDEYLGKGVFEQSQGAIICDLEKFDLGPALVRKSDGTSLYMTWDLVLASRKFEEFDIERSLYVVASEQSYHFRQLFATLERMGYGRAKDCRHVAYELVMMAEGKMSSRKGKVVTYADVRDSISTAIESKMRADDRDSRDDWSEERWDRTVRTIAAACMRYGMVSVGNTTRVVFDAEAWTSLEGETGAYLLYGLARIRGVFRKAGEVTDAQLVAGAREADEFGAEAERALLSHLLRAGEVLATVERTTDVSGLATWIYEGVRAFSRFYHDCPILNAPAPLREARLGLARAAEHVLGDGLRTLGIEPLDEM